MHHHYFEGLKSDAERHRAHRLPGLGRQVHGHGPGDALGDGAVRPGGGRDPGHRGDLAQLDAGVRHHRRLRLRRRRLAHPRRHRVSREYGIPCVVGTSVATAADQDRRHHRGRRHQGRRHDHLERAGPDATRERRWASGSSSPAGLGASGPSWRPNCARGAPTWSRSTSATGPTSTATSAPPTGRSTPRSTTVGDVDGLVNNAAGCRRPGSHRTS